MASPRAQAYLDHWLSHRRALLELVDRLPESAAGFRPWPEAMTLAGLLQHIALSAERFQSAVRDGAFPDPAAAPPRPEAPRTIAEARELLRDKTAAGEALLAGLSDAQMDATLTFQRLGMSGPALMFLAAGLDHEAHHKGQVWTYARLCGVEPPNFRSMRR